MLQINFTRVQYVHVLQFPERSQEVSRVCIVSKFVLDLYIFFIFTRPLRGFAKKNKFHKPEITMEVGGSRSHSDFFVENLPKIALSQC